MSKKIYRHISGTIENLKRQPSLTWPAGSFAAPVQPAPHSPRCPTSPRHRRSALPAPARPSGSSTGAFPVRPSQSIAQQARDPAASPWARRSSVPAAGPRPPLPAAPAPCRTCISGAHKAAGAANYMARGRRGAGCVRVPRWCAVLSLSFALWPRAMSQKAPRGMLVYARVAASARASDFFAFYIEWKWDARARGALTRARACTGCTPDLMRRFLPLQVRATCK